MKNRFFTLLTAVIVIIFASCSDDKQYTFDNTPVLFNSTVGVAEVQTRASGTTWDKGDAIGVYMKRNAGFKAILNGAENKRHTTGGAGVFSPAHPTNDAIFLPEDGQGVDFIAYYPHTTALEPNHVYKVDVTNQSSQEAIDLLYSDNAKGITNKDVVSLNFAHRLTKVVFNITGGNNVSDLTGMTVKIVGMHTKTTFSLEDGVLGTAESPANITLKTTIASTNSALSEGIVIPAASVKGGSVIFSIPSAGDFVWNIPENEVFESGKKNVYTVELKRGNSANVLPNATIIDWGAGSSENIVIDLGGDEPVITGDGSKVNPYLVNEAVTKIGETDKWITGYIVGSTNTARVGTPSKTNILLAPTAGETDEAKCIIVDLNASTVQENLDIITFPELIGKQVKIKGNIVNNLFGGLPALTAVTEQEGGATPTPPTPPTDVNLLFDGSDFENWSVFTGGLSTHGLKTYAVQNATGGRNGSSALHIKGTPPGNDFIFTPINKKEFTGTPSKIILYIKGKADKSLSFNVYLSDKTFKPYNLEDCSADKTLEVQPNNQYTGVINTNEEWIKITLNVAGLDIQKTIGENIFAVKVGKTVNYDLLIDDITFE